MKFKFLNVLLNKTTLISTKKCIAQNKLLSCLLYTLEKYGKGNFPTMHIYVDNKNEVVHCKDLECNFCSICVSKYILINKMYKINKI